MSWTRVTYWAFRCDGETTYGQCPELIESSHGASGYALDGAWIDLPMLVDSTLSPSAESLNPQTLAAMGWLRTEGPNGRALCPQHVAAQEQLAQAHLDGLPFPD